MLQRHHAHAVPFREGYLLFCELASTKKNKYRKARRKFFHLLRMCSPKHMGQNVSEKQLLRQVRYCWKNFASCQNINENTRIHLCVLEWIVSFWGKFFVAVKKELKNGVVDFFDGVGRIMEAADKVLCMIGRRYGKRIFKLKNINLKPGYKEKVGAKLNDDRNRLWN